MKVRRGDGSGERIKASDAALALKPEKRPWHRQFKRASAETRTLDGIVFDSTGEMRRYKVLKMLERDGLIRDLRRQVKFPLVVNGKPVLIRSEAFPNGRRAIYTADFAYERKVETNLCTVWERVVEEYKGHDDPAGRLRRAVAEACHGIRVEVSGAGRARRRF